MNISMPALMALLGIFVNVAVASTWLFALLSPRCKWVLVQPLRTGCLRPIAVAVVVHWLLYFGPINFGALVLQSNVQETYSWVIRRHFMAAAAVHSLVSYGLILSLMALLAGLLEWQGLNQELRPVPRASRRQILMVAVFLAVISALIAPVIGTTAANGGAWVNAFPWLLRPWVKGLFLLEAIPLIAVGSQVLAADDPPPRQERRFLVLLVALQLLTFVLLRQRFLSLLAVLWVLVWLLRWWRKPVLWLWLTVGLSLAYVMPTALRYTRVARASGQTLEAYLTQSWQNFLVGLQPLNLVASAVNDFSYNKAGLASLSVVLDLRRSGVLSGSDVWAWIFADLYRATPGEFKPMLSNWAAGGAELSVTRALGVGLPEWSNPGVSAELARGWVVDLMETPLLDSVTTGGWEGLIWFSSLTALLLSAFWCFACSLSRCLPFLWLLPFGVLGVVSLGSSWLGDLLVFGKVVLPWILLCGCFASVCGKCDSPYT